MGRRNSRAYRKEVIAETAVFLDPPYLTQDRANLYSSDYMKQPSDDTAWESYEWAVEHGAKHGYRIAYCCHDSDFPIPDGWTILKKSFGGIQRADRQKSKRDMIMFSPGCLLKEDAEQMEVFAK